MGTRGIPANHGGFEACIENLAPFLASKNFEVHVFRQIDDKEKIQSFYKGVKLVNIITTKKGALGTILFDIFSTAHTIKNYKNNALILTFGYPTAFLFPILKLYGFTNIVNMDGVEWKRKQFGLIGKIWCWLNEKIAVLTADALIADHAKIKDHLSKINFFNKPIYVVAYSADDIRKVEINGDKVTRNLKKIILSKEYMLVMARLEPDNQILEIIRSFSASHRPFNLIIAGRLDLRNNKYHKKLVEFASDQVYFVGGIYNLDDKIFLRNNAIAYIHGHTVGGTNPSLVEALGSRSAIIAHFNEFNFGVAENGALYFSSEDSLSRLLSEITETNLNKTRLVADQIFCSYTHEKINSSYYEIIQHFKKTEQEPIVLF